MYFIFTFTGLGTFSGGYVAKRFRLTRTQVLKMYIYCQLITIPTSLGLLFYCNSSDFAGVNIGYGDATWTQPQEVLHPLDMQFSCNDR
jgi:hypothetical protein